MKRNMDVPWSYQGENGPEYWHTLCDWYQEGAEFPFQSPISLVRSETQQKGIKPISFHYQKERFTEKEFKNTIHFVPYDCTSYVLFEEKKYLLTDIHYHMPSEHWLDGEQKEIEFHLVHMDKAGNNLVVGVLFQLCEQEMPFKAGDSWDFDNHLEIFDPTIFLPRRRSHFHYVGSLTTPPTKGPINWFVFDEVGKMSRRFIEEFREEVLENNNRPLQEKLDRGIFYFEE
ncbi:MULTISPECIES: carbonic anhydrase family protein [Enterococcus]|uniref:carbonic anhydrase family protein n=1 Tax=Enterococcus TaxID=1350 RepID=UPI001D98003D|nr:MULTISPECIES: carbonic anhydrase family protein [Enterococcus]KAF1302500.1 carbonic anhydrase [Enterococcus sp. JM9B]